MSYIQVENVVKRFGSLTVLKGISLSVEKGEMVTLLGPSGCGKSTLLRAIAGLNQVEAGSIHIDGADVTYVDVRERNVGMIFQSYALFPNMSAFRNIAFGLSIQKRPKVEIQERVREMMALVGLEGKENALPSQLSGGQQQRVALARALVMRPKVLLLDEPLSALDAQIRKTLRVQLREIQKKIDMTAIFVTHDQEEAMSISDRIFVMHDGTIVQNGAPGEVYAHPENEFVVRFIGHYNLLEEEAAQRILGLAEGCGKIAIRPEVFSLEPGEGNRTLTGRVQRSTLLGSIIRYQLEAEGVPISVEFINHKADVLGVGETVRLYVAEGDLVRIGEG